MPTPKYNKTKQKDTERSFQDYAEYILHPVSKLISHYGQPARMLLEDVIGNNVKVPIQKAIGVTPSRDTYTEKDFSIPYLNTLDSINVSQLDRQVPDWRERTARGDTVTIGVHGSQYVPNYGGGQARSIKERMTTPIGQIETTLGSYRVQATKDNILTFDTYDWNKIPAGQLKASNYSTIRDVAGALGTSDEAPDNEKSHVRIKSKRKTKRSLKFTHPREVNGIIWPTK